MQQRVGLARALATNAEILLMDEAFSALDPLIRTDMQNILLDLQKELKKTIVFITHDLDEALRIGDNIAILRDGEIVQQGNPQEIIMKPADKYISDFIKDINRGKVIKLKSIMKNDRKVLDIKIDQETTIEDSIHLINKGKNKSCNVIDKEGNIIGSVTLNSLLDALVEKKKVSSEKWNTSQKQYILQENDHKIKVILTINYKITFKWKSYENIEIFFSDNSQIDYLKTICSLFLMRKQISLENSSVYHN